MYPKRLSLNFFFNLILIRQKVIAGLSDRILCINKIISKIVVEAVGIQLSIQIFNYICILVTWNHHEIFTVSYHSCL
jgi:hypothetical protein